MVQFLLVAISLSASVNKAKLLEFIFIHCDVSSSKGVKLFKISINAARVNLLEADISKSTLHPVACISSKLVHP